MLKWKIIEAALLESDNLEVAVLKLENKVFLVDIEAAVLKFSMVYAVQNLWKLL